MKGDDRHHAQTAFMDDKAEVIVAATAFGMGIDKANVHFVCHAEISGCLDSYYQEIGRAGRDSEAAQAILFYHASDLNLRRFFASGRQVDADELAEVAHLVQQHKESIDPKALLEQTDLSKTKLQTALNRLTEAGVVEPLATGEIVLAEEAPDLETATAAALKAQGRQHQFDRSRLEMMCGYAEMRNCRRQYLLNYFGETLNEPCGYCDNCKAVPIEEQASYQPFPLSSRVEHKEWGKGLVMRYEEDKVVVLFDEVGYETLKVKRAVLFRLLSKIT